MHSLWSHVQKQDLFITNVTLLTSDFVSSPLSIFIFNIIFDGEGSCSCCRRVGSRGEKDSPLSFRRTEQFQKNWFSLLQKCKTVTFIPWRERELVSLSLGFILDHSTTMHINVVKLSLNGNGLSWLVPLCGVPLVSGRLLARIHGCFTSASSFSIYSGYVGLVLTLSLLFSHGSQRKQVHPRIFHTFQKQREVCQSSPTISVFPLLARKNK